MTESKIYADNYSCTFKEPGEFLDFLRDRKEHSQWLTAPSKSLQLQSIEKDSAFGNLYMQLYQHNGRAEILADTMENTSIMLSVQGQEYPVRSCALKTILERARISGHALNKVSKEVFTQILNYCLGVASGDSLIKVADEKVSAVHGGDPDDYAVLEMLPLFEKVQDYLESEFPGCHFMTGSFDHTLAMAIWSLDGQSDELLDTYRRELLAKGLGNKVIRPGLRFMTSDVGVSGANLYPILLVGSANKIVPLGYPIKTEHSNRANMDYFDEQLRLLYARFEDAIEKQMKLMHIDIQYPYTAMLGALKRVGVTKKLSYEAADMFAAQNGLDPCTAYEVFLAMTEVIFLAQCNGATAGKIAQLEEYVARTLSINWHEYDRPGDFKW